MFPSYKKNGENRKAELNKKRIIVGITGASGAIYGLTLLKSLNKIDQVEIHLIISDTARYILNEEIDENAMDMALSMSHYNYDINDQAAKISSGTFKTDGMIIAPCSAKYLSSIANSYGSNLISRAADVVLKERRTLVLLFRETPLNLGHIENMHKVTMMGGIILPPIPAFYNKPQSLEEVINHSIGKALDFFHFEHNLYKSWEGKNK
jgi:4-hydroxy-3-polyprenylbenzoate decarboxylase